MPLRVFRPCPDGSVLVNGADKVNRANVLPGSGHRPDEQLLNQRGMVRSTRHHGIQNDGNLLLVRPGGGKGLDAAGGRNRSCFDDGNKRPIGELDAQGRLEAAVSIPILHLQSGFEWLGSEAADPDGKPLAGDRTCRNVPPPSMEQIRHYGTRDKSQ